MREGMYRKWRKYGLELLLLVLCGILLSSGISRKEGYHMDELLSFELSNARFTPWIVPTQPQGRLDKFVEQEIEGATFGETLGNLWDTVVDVLQNKGESKLLSYQADVYEEPVWISAQQFNDYITVQDQDAFQYLSVYFNVKDDNHPPLHFMVLHTLSSIFRGKAEPFIGCLINLAALLGTIWLLMALGRAMARELGLEKYARTAGLLAGGLYGLSAGALSTVLLIRMYGMLTFFCVALLYLHLKKWQDRGFGAHNKGLILVTALGFWTQYFFLFYCLLLAAVTVVLLWGRKRQREAWIYLRSMAAAAVLGVGLFPFAIQDVFSSGRGVEALNNLSEGMNGYGSRLAAFGRIVLDGIRYRELLAAVLLLTVLLLFERGRKKSQGVQPEPVRASRHVLAMLLIPAAGYFLLAARMSPYLVDRYVMPVYPFAALAAALTVITLTAKWTECSGRGRKRMEAGWICAILLLVQLQSHWSYDGEYFYRGYRWQEELAGEYAALDCICIYDGVGYYENLKEFTYYEKTLLTTLEELENRQDKASIRELEQVVVLIKQNVDWKKAAEVLSGDYGLELSKDLCAMQPSDVHGDSIFLFERP